MVSVLSISFYTHTNLTSRIAELGRKRQKDVYCLWMLAVWEEKHAWTWGFVFLQTLCFRKLHIVVVNCNQHGTWTFICACAAVKNSNNNNNPPLILEFNTLPKQNFGSVD